jgi:hypothetical protein
MEQRPVEHGRADGDNVLRRFLQSLHWNAPLGPTAHQSLGIGLQQDQDGAWHEVVLEGGGIGDLTSQCYALLPPQTP